MKKHFRLKKACLSSSYFSVVVGITGSMGMGKSTLVKLLKSQGPYAVFEADQEIKKLYLTLSVIKKLENLEEDFIQNKQVNQKKLVQFILKDPSHLQKLETILYPELASVRKKFLQKCRYYQMPLVFLDIPLLFEKQMQFLCDVILVVHCPEWLQEKRLQQRLILSRPLQSFLKQQQLPSAVKRKRADSIILTGLNQRHTLEQLTRILKRIKQ